MKTHRFQCSSRSPSKTSPLRPPFDEFLSCTGPDRNATLVANVVKGNHPAARCPGPASTSGAPVIVSCTFFVGLLGPQRGSGNLGGGLVFLELHVVGFLRVPGCSRGGGVPGEP